MQGGQNKYAGLQPADVTLFEELVQIGREMRCYPGHDIIAKKTGLKTRSAVSCSFCRLETVGLIARQGRGSNFSGIVICASGRRIDVSRAGRVPPKPGRRPSAGGFRVR